MKRKIYVAATGRAAAAGRAAAGRATAAGITAAFLLFFTLPAYGAAYVDSNYEGTYTAVDGNEISEERLADSTIEYEELGSLIHANNTAVQEMTESREENRQKYAEIRDYLTEEMERARRKRDDAKDSGDMDSYAEYASLVGIYQASAKGYNTMMQNLDKKSSNSSRISQEKQLTSSAQSLMISYESLVIQKENLETMEALYEEQYNNARTGLSAGLAVEQDVMTAYQNWLGARVSLDSVKTSMESVYQSLCMLTGMNTDGSVTIARLPLEELQAEDELQAADENPETGSAGTDSVEMENDGTAGISLEEDISKAIGNNTDLISIRSDSSDSSTSGMAVKARKEQETEEQLRMKMTQLYEELQQAQTALKAAKQGYASAQISWKNTQSKQSLGMLSRAEYLQEEITYMQKKASYESAKVTLFQARQTYDWAVKGIVTLE